MRLISERSMQRIPMRREGGMLIERIVRISASSALLRRAKPQYYMKKAAPCGEICRKRHERAVKPAKSGLSRIYHHASMAAYILESKQKSEGNGNGDNQASYAESGAKTGKSQHEAMALISEAAHWRMRPSRG